MAREHNAQGTCCAPRRVKLQAGLYQRLRGRPYYMPDDYARKVASFEGQLLRVSHTFEGEGGVYAYTIEFPDGTYGHLPALYADLE